MANPRTDRSGRGMKFLVGGIDKTSNHDSGAGKVQTTDGTANVVLLALQTKQNVGYTIKARITGRKTDSSKVGGYEIQGAFINNAGALSQQGATSTPFNQATDGAWSVAFAISGTQVQVVVTGKNGDVIDWACEYKAVIAY